MALFSPKRAYFELFSAQIPLGSVKILEAKLTSGLLNRTNAMNYLIILNISPWAYIREGLYSHGFFVNESLGLYSRGLIIEGAYTRDFTVF